MSNVLVDFEQCWESPVQSFFGKQEEYVSVAEPQSSKIIDWWWFRNEVRWLVKMNQLLTFKTSTYLFEIGVIFIKKETEAINNTTKGRF